MFFQDDDGLCHEYCFFSYRIDLYICVILFHFQTLLVGFFNIIDLHKVKNLILRPIKFSKAKEELITLILWVITN